MDKTKYPVRISNPVSDFIINLPDEASELLGGEGAKVDIRHFQVGKAGPVEFLIRPDPNGKWTISKESTRHYALRIAWRGKERPVDYNFGIVNAVHPWTWNGRRLYFMLPKKSKLPKDKTKTRHAPKEITLGKSPKPKAVEEPTAPDEAVLKSEAVSVKMTPAEVHVIDDWRRKQKDLPTRPEAIRRLIKKGLK